MSPFYTFFFIFLNKQIFFFVTILSYLFLFIIFFKEIKKKREPVLCMPYRYMPRTRAWGANFFFYRFCHAFFFLSLNIFGPFVLLYIKKMSLLIILFFYNLLDTHITVLFIYLLYYFWHNFYLIFITIQI